MFRLEHEHLNNCGELKAFKMVDHERQETDLFYHASNSNLLPLVVEPDAEGEDDREDDDDGGEEEDEGDDERINEGNEDIEDPKSPLDSLEKSILSIQEYFANASSSPPPSPLATLRKKDSMMP